MQIYNHETDIDITHKLNNYELKAWIKHLLYLQNEIKLLEKMYSLEIDEELAYKFIIQQLKEKEIELKDLLESIKNYKIAKPSDFLCEDFQCDLELISAHENHRNNYLNFLNNYRKLKNKIFSEVKGWPVTENYNELKYG